MLPLGGAVTSARRLLGERQPDEPLVHVERMRGRAWSDEYDRCDVRRVRRLHLQRVAVSIVRTARLRSSVVSRAAIRR